MEVSTICTRGSPRMRPSTKMKLTTTPAISARRLPSTSSCCCSGVGPASVAASRPEMRPISVAMPVAVTIISARPRVTTEFM